MWLKLSGLVMVFLLLAYGYIPTIIGKLKYRKGFSGNSGEIMLTFDDGPSREYTNQVLDLLEQEKIRASFFLVADYINHNKDIVKRMVDSGHTVGMHSKSHRPIIYRGYSYTKKDLENSMAIFKDNGLEVKYYRPPWGQINIWMYFLLKKHKIEKVLWNVMAEDWKANTTSEEIGAKILARTREASIICLHDGRGRNEAPKRTIEALKMVIPQLKVQGYKFITVGEKFDEENI